MYSVNQYDEIAEKYDSLFIDKASIRENEQVARMLRNVKTPVMDIGCGTGLLIDQLLGFDVDFSPSSEYEDSTEEDETVTQKEEISKEEVEAFKEKERKIEDGMKQEATEYIEMKCPHCGEIIRMRK